MPLGWRLSVFGQGQPHARLTLCSSDGARDTVRRVNQGGGQGARFTLSQSGLDSGSRAARRAQDAVSLPRPAGADAAGWHSPSNQQSCELNSPQAKL